MKPYIKKIVWLNIFLLLLGCVSSVKNRLAANMNHEVLSELISFKSASDESRNIVGARYQPKSFDKNLTVIFLVGGSSGITNFPDDLDRDSFADRFLSSGYNFVIPKYRGYIKRTVQDIIDGRGGYRDKEDFERDSSIQLNDIRKFIEDYHRMFPEEKLVILGHSYGGYMLNLLATENQPTVPIHGYISSYGIWGPAVKALRRNEDDKYNHIISVVPHKLPPMLALFSKRDTQLGDQTGYFEKWLTGNPHDIRRVVFNSNSHFLDEKRNVDFQRWNKEVFLFLSELSLK